jgi:hypothetical protein
MAGSLPWVKQTAETCLDFEELSRRAFFNAARSRKEIA